MDYKTKSYYRNKIKEIAKRTKISELYITQKALELAQSNVNNVVESIARTKEKSSVGASYVSTQQNDNQSSVNTNKKSHIGYYLISDGIKELYKTLQTNKKPKQTKNNVTLYITVIIFLSIIISSLLSFYIYKQTSIVLSIITFILTYIPVTEITTEIIQYILNKIVKPTQIPKMDYTNGVRKKTSYNGNNTNNCKIAEKSKRLNFKTRSILSCK